MGDTPWGASEGNRHEHSDGQQQGQNDGEHGREKSKCEHALVNAGKRDIV
jgi:hypothetical protein